MSSPLRVLLVDDNPDDRALVIRSLRLELGEIEAIEATDRESYEAAIELGRPDITITDYQLRWADGLTVLRQLKHRDPNHPVVMFTGSGSEEVAVAGMQQGLDDYVLKTPRHYARLPAAVRGALAVARHRAAEQATREAEEARAVLESQLLQAQKMEAIGRLAGGIAHDFQNLLTVVNGYSELALRHIEPDSPARQYVEEIKEAGRRAIALTRQLLAFSRKQPVQPRRTDINSIVVGIEAMLGRLIGEDVELVTRLQVELGPVYVDPGQLEHVIVNLAVNARDAMPDGGRLTIETAPADLDASYGRAHGVALTPGAFAVLAVSDTGHGMDAEVRSHIFEPFFTTKEPGQGTGLGLAMAYGVVKQAGGFIWVYSEPEEGTTFKIYLPCVQDKGDAPPPQRTQHGERLEAIRGTETILVVEDENALRTFACKALTDNGYRVLDAKTGHDAIELATNYPGPIDLLLTDVVMPGMRGTALARELVASRPGLRVLYMSAYTERAVASGADKEVIRQYLEKPFSPDQLALKVRDTLDTSLVGSGDP